MTTPLEYPIHSQDSKSFCMPKSPLARPIKLGKRLVFLALSAGILLFSARGAGALTVTTVADSGAGSLRQAILDAVSGDTIDFSLPPNRTITLTSAELLINKSLTIAGPAVGLLDVLAVQRSTAGGTPDFRIFHITGVSDVTISGLTISNGSSGNGDGGGMLNDSGGTVNVIDCTLDLNTTTNGNGGGLSNTGTMTVANTNFSGNSSTVDGNGGGIDNEGNLDVSNSTVSGNSTANGNGGGVFNDASATFTGCTFSANTATTGGNGGGIYNFGDITVSNNILSNNTTMSGGNGGALYDDGTSTITDTSFNGNSTAGGGNGGAIYGTDSTDLTSCTLSNNSAMDGGNGGGIYVLGTVNVANSTLNGNSTAGGGSGGGIYSDDGTVNVVNCTISANFTAGGGDGGGIASPFLPLSITNTIVALNTGDGTGPDVSGDFTSQGFNLIGQSDGSTGFTNGVNGDQAGTAAAPLDPLLGALQNNGGPTFTQALLFGSPAIDQGAPATNPSTGDPIITDQRGLTRPVDRPNIANATGGNGSDIGAFEVQTPSLLLNISTRLNVLTGGNVLIGGFIVTGTDPKIVAIRAIGPSLANSVPPVPDALGIGPSLANSNPPIPAALADPVLELHKPDGTVVTNNDWMTNSSTDQATIVANGLDMYNGAPISDLESIIIATLPPADSSVPGSGEYTAVVSGNGGTTGVGLVEIYDLDPQPAASQLANISTRGFVETDANVMIGGFIVGGGGGGGATVLVRAIGPSLTAKGVSGALADPALDLYDINGTIIASNDNWKDTQEAEITATTIPPTDDLESAIEDFLVPGNYTAIVHGVNNTTGVALVETYNLD